MRTRRVIALVPLVLGPIAFASWIFWPVPATTVAIDAPVSLSQREIRLPPFETQVTWLYLIEIEFTKNGLDKKLPCLTGSVENCNDAVPALSLNWLLSSNGKRIAQSSITQDAAGAPSSNGTFSREIGRFRAEKGRRYQLQINVNRSSAALDAYEPHIVVSAFPTYLERQSAITLYAFAFMIVCLITGTLMLICWC